MAHEGFLKDRCGPRAKKFEQHWRRVFMYCCTVIY